MRYRGLDLNLIVALDALLRDRSVSRAAERTHVTQPAMSAALRRLRLFYRDPLLVPLGRQMTLTPVAEALVEPIGDMLRHVDQAVLQPRPFDPSVSDRKFCVRVADSVLVGVLLDGLKSIARMAPNISFQFISPGVPAGTLLERGEVDLIILPTRMTLSHHPSAVLLEDDHSVVACAQNPIEEVSLETFQAAGHVEVEVWPNPGYLEKQLSDLGIDRRVEIRVDTFVEVPFFVSDSLRLATMPSATAAFYQKLLPLKLFEPPFPLENVKLSMQWLRTRDRDPALLWLREQIATAAHDKNK